jgi:Nif-specific regulatory protein
MLAFDYLNCGDCLNTRELTMLYEIAVVMSNSVDIAASLEKTLYILENRLHLKSCVIHTLSDDNLLTVYACISLNKFQKASSIYKVGEGVTGFAAESKEPIIIENIHNNIMFLNKTGSRDKNSISYIAVPMLLNQKVIGVWGGANTTKITPNDFNNIVRVLTVISSIFVQAYRVSQYHCKRKRAFKRTKTLLQNGVGFKGTQLR